MKRLRSLCLKRVTDILKKYTEFDFSSFLPSLLSCLSDRISLLPKQNTQSSVGLMQTFLELAQSEKLAEYLFSIDSVLPSIFACLSAPKAAVTVRQDSLTIASTLLTKGHYDRMRAHIPAMLSHIHVHMRASELAGGIRSSKDPHVQRQQVYLLRQQFSVLSHISAYPCEATQAAQLVELLIPFLNPGRKLGGVAASMEARLFVLNSLCNLIARVDAPETYAETAARQLMIPASDALRTAACRLVASLGKSVHRVSSLVSDMNAMSKTRLEDYDFDLRLEAYNKCTTEFLDGLHSRELLILACQCMHDVRDKDISIRNHAFKLVASICNTLLVVEGGEEDGGEKGNRYFLIIWPSTRPQCAHLNFWDYMTLI